MPSAYSKSPMLSRKHKAYIALALFACAQIFAVYIGVKDWVKPVISTENAAIQYGEELNVYDYIIISDDRSVPWINKYLVRDKKGGAKKGVTELGGGSFRFDKSGIYEIVLSVSDDGGNHAEGTIEVSVEDHDPPIITELADSYEVLARQAVYLRNNSTSLSLDIGIADEGSDVEMAVDSIVPLYSEEEASYELLQGGFKISEPGDYEMTITATDTCDNATTATTVLYVHEPPPVEPSPGPPVDTEKVEKRVQTDYNAFRIPSKDTDCLLPLDKAFLTVNAIVGPIDESLKDFIPKYQSVEPGLYRFIADKKPDHPEIDMSNILSSSGSDGQSFSRESGMSGFFVNAKYAYFTEGQRFSYFGSRMIAFPAAKAPRTLFTQVNRNGEYLAGVDIVPGTYHITQSFNYGSYWLDEKETGSWFVYDYVGFPRRVAAEGTLGKGESIDVEIADGQILELRNAKAERVE